ncbi:dynein light chain roadblock-type 1 isoform X1 [Microtus oregoni]|nr:dynein light chain roadblock-type 1 isoform X1 [Microtus oregoni]
MPQALDRKTVCEATPRRPALCFACSLAFRAVWGDPSQAAAFAGVQGPSGALGATCVAFPPPLCEAEVEETLKRLQSQKGVQGIIVVNTEGIPIKSTMDNPTTTQYANLMHNFILKARSTVREIDPQNDLTFLRIRSKKNEIMVAPDKDYFLIVIQNPTE